MKFDKVAPRYSKALFQLEGSKEQRLGILEQLLHLWKNDPNVGSFLASPTVSKDEKMNFFEKILGDHQDKNLLSFLNLIIQNNRSKVIPSIIKDFRKKVIDSMGILEVTLSTAVPIDAKDKETLKQKLESQNNRKVEIKEKIDPKMIGGVILTIGDKLLDFSINGRLENLRKQLCQ